MTCRTAAFGRPSSYGDDAAITKAIRATTTEFGVGLVEPGEWLCTDDHRCPAIIGDILVYRDGNHISETAATWLAPLLDLVLAPFVEGWVAQPA